MIKDRLNDFETDWAAMPQVEKEKLEKLKGKTVLVCGHTIGEYALIAAGAVVTKNVAPHSLMAGIPAKRIGWACVCGNVFPSAFAVTIAVPLFFPVIVIRLFEVF